MLRCEHECFFCAPHVAHTSANVFSWLTDITRRVAPSGNKFLFPPCPPQDAKILCSRTRVEDKYTRDVGFSFSNAPHNQPTRVFPTTTPQAQQRATSAKGRGIHIKTFFETAVDKPATSAENNPPESRGREGEKTQFRDSIQNSRITKRCTTQPPRHASCALCEQEHMTEMRTRIHSQHQERATATHISQRDRKALARWNHHLHNRTC